ncbi:MAG TPA: transcriptional regulator [Acidimicrobiales bacterium]|nr:transcriptional regulator [Acidimicrobiales bacterium]
MDPDLQTEPTGASGRAAGPTDGLDDVVHQRVRLGILTITNEATRVEFRFLLDSLGLTAGNLSQHLRVLENAGLVRIEKGVEGRRPRTWIAITKTGRLALRQEITSLKALVRRVESSEIKSDHGSQVQRQ